MTESNLHHSVQQWQNGNKPACWRVCEWLWQRLSAETVRFVHALLDSRLEEHERMQRAENLASNTFWAAMEELDLKVSGGKLLTESTGNHKNVRQRDGQVVSRAVFRGVVSDRKLSAKASLQWQGTESFAALFKDMWSVRCWDAWRGETPVYTASGYEYDQLTGKMQEVKRHVRRERVSIEPTRGENDEKQGGVYEDETASDQPDGQTFSLEIDDLRALIAALAQVTEQLRSQKKEALAEVGEALLGYAREQMQSVHSGGGRIFIEFDETEAWVFVQKTLGLSRDVTYKRKERFLQTVATLPQAPELFRSERMPAGRKG